jgi:hypothetical protein
MHIITTSLSVMNIASWGVLFLGTMGARSNVISLSYPTSNISLSLQQTPIDAPATSISSKISTSNVSTSNLQVKTTSQDVPHSTPHPIFRPPPTCVHWDGAPIWALYNGYHPFFTLPDNHTCYYLWESSSCAWHSSAWPATQATTTDLSRPVETTTKVVERDIVIEKVEISEISFTTLRSYMTFEDDDYFLNPNATSWQTKTFTFSPPSLCCGTCMVYGGDVQVYF